MSGMKIFAGIAVVAVWLLSIAAYITHIVVCIKTAAWLFLVIGMIFAPVAIIHGWLVWFGVV